MAATKAVIVIIHGVWQRQYQYELLGQSLLDKGFEVLRPESATAGSELARIRGKTHLDDVDVIHEAIEPSLAAGKEIVLVCHSYGGIPATAAAEGYQIHDRKEKGLTGGIKHIVYLAATALPAKGLSLINAIGGSYSNWMDKRDDVVSLTDHAKDALFNDADPGAAAHLLAGCVYQSAASLETPTAFVGSDAQVAKTYVACEFDHAMPIEGQLAMASALGENTTTIQVQSGHSVYRNPNVLSIILDAVEEAAQD